MASVIKIEDNRRNDTFSQTSSLSSRKYEKNRSSNIFNLADSGETDSMIGGKRKVFNH